MKRPIMQRTYNVQYTRSDKAFHPHRTFSQLRVYMRLKHLILCNIFNIPILKTSLFVIRVLPSSIFIRKILKWKVVTSTWETLQHHWKNTEVKITSKAVTINQYCNSDQHKTSKSPPSLLCVYNNADVFSDSAARWIQLEK